MAQSIKKVKILQKMKAISLAFNGKQIPLCAQHCDKLYVGKVLMIDIDLNIV
jgi:hypothetical protein